MPTFTPKIKFSLALWILVATPVFAVNEKGDWPWNIKLNGIHDAPIAKDLGVGFFLNVGPTGLRARITHEHPEFFTVKYVFEDSPAHGLIEIDDLIVGANGDKFTIPHQFGRRSVTGWEGPMMEMSKRIEDSQGGDGKLELIVWPKGDKNDEKTVAVQLRPVGRFSPTFPFNCERSDKLMIELCDFLEAEYKREGKFESRVHTHSTAVLAMMAGGDPKYETVLKKIMSGYESNRYAPTNGTGFQAWNWMHDGIVMGEYYLLTKDKALLPAMESLTECLTHAQDPETGGYSHRPFPFIMTRLAGGGPKGYGAMALPGALGMLSMSLFKEAGVPYAEPAYERLHQAFLSSAKENGAIDYGFAIRNNAVIELADESGFPKSAERGIGFQCPQGMEQIGDYSIVWPTKADPRYRPTDWLDEDRDNIRVFDMGENKRLAVRTMTKPEPTEAIPHNGKATNHIARVGAGALSHAIGNRDQPSWKLFSDHLATSCAKSYRQTMDGHASTHMHVVWGSLGAALADEKDFREFMDYTKWWFIMAQTHDGSFVVMPGRDYASTDHVYGGRNFPTACAALILSVKEKHLQITGAGSGTAQPAATEEVQTMLTTPERQFTNAEGKAITAKLVSFSGPDEFVKNGNVLLLTHRSKTPIEYPLNKLSPADQEYAKSAVAE